MPGKIKGARAGAARGAVVVRAPRAKTGQFTKRVAVTYGKDKKATPYRAKPTPMLRYRKATRVLGVGKTSPQAALEYFDPALKHNQRDSIALPSTLGNFVTVNSASGVTFAPGPTNGDLYVVFQAGYAPVGAFWWYTSGTEPDKVRRIEYNNLLSDTPSTMRYSRSSLVFTNLTNDLNREGLMEYVMTPAGLEWAFGTAIGNSPVVSADFKIELNAMMTQHPQSRVKGADTVAKGINLISCPSSIASLTEWRDFYPWSVASTVGARENALETAAGKMSFTTTVVRFTAPTSEQAIHLKCHTQFMCRYPANTLLGAMGKKGPEATPAQLNALVTTASEVQAEGGSGPSAYREPPPQLWRDDPPPLR